MNEKLLPNIYDFKDPIAFLEANFSVIKDESLSIRKWADQLGFSSPDNFVEIMKRKRKISGNVLDLLASGLKLDQAEKNYFEAINKYVNAETIKEKNILELVVAELVQLQGKKALVKDMNIFSHWVHMAILGLAKVKVIKLQKETIRDYLLEDVSQDIINDAVDLLIEKKLLIEENGSLIKPYDHVTSENDAFKHSPHKYFEHVSELAKKGSQVPSHEREFQCFTISIKSSEMDTFKTAFRNFRAKLGSLESSDEADKVYQCNLQFFPLTDNLKNTVINKMSEEISQGV